MNWLSPKEASQLSWAETQCLEETRPGLENPAKTGKVVQQLKAPDALPEDKSSFSSTPVEWLTMIC